MKQTTLFIFCLLAMAFGSDLRAASQVTHLRRADAILKCSDRVYSPLSVPNGIIVLV